jgi:exodeoxyribonuclease VII small subunit
MARLTTASYAMVAAVATDDGFDALLARLRDVVVRLESGELSLEDSLAAYEEGVALARRGHDLLAAAEKRVEIVVSASGTIETAPLGETNGS